MASGGTVVFGVCVGVWFVMTPPTSAVLPLFVTMMACSGLRTVPYQTLCSQVPRPHERARFMSMQSSVQHIATTCGAFMSSFLLEESENGMLVGMENVAWTAIALSATMPLLMYAVQRLLHERGRLEQQADIVVAHSASETMSA